MSAPPASTRTTHKLTASRFKSLMDCPRAHQHRYVQGYAPLREARALRFGTLIHHGLEAWWGAHRDGAPCCREAGADCEAVERAAEAIEAQASPESDAFERMTALVLLVGYDVRWCLWASTVEVLGVEMGFSGVPLPRPSDGRIERGWTLAGKIDALLRLHDGRVCLLEHKSSSEDVAVGSIYQRELAINAQVSQYFEGAAWLGYPASVCTFDVLKKPGIQPYKATPEEDRVYTEPKSRKCKQCGKKKAPPPPHLDEEAGVECVDGRVVTDVGGRLRTNQRAEDETPEEWCSRLVEYVAENSERTYVQADVTRSDGQRSNHMKNLWSATQAIELYERTGIHPQNFGACHKYGECAFFDVCTEVADLDDFTRFRRLDDVHPELSR